MDEGASSPGPPRPPNRARHEQELELLAGRVREAEVERGGLLESVRHQRGLLSRVRGEREQLNKTRAGVFQQLELANSEVRARGDAVQKLRAGLPHQRLAEVEEQAGRLEMQLVRRTLTTQEERRITTEIDRLKRSKRALQQLEKEKAELSKARAAQQSAREGREQWSRTGRELRQQEEQVRQELGLLLQRAEHCKQQADQARQQRRDTLDKFRAQSDLHRAWLAERRIRQQRRTELERAEAAHSLAREEAELRATAEPLLAERQLCSALLQYCDRLGGGGVEGVAENSEQPGNYLALPLPTLSARRRSSGFSTASGASSHYATPCGRSPASTPLSGSPPVSLDADKPGFYVKKKDENNEIFFAGSKKKVKRPRSERRLSLKKGVTHNPETFVQFSSLGIAPPTSPAAVPDVSRQLRDKLQQLELRAAEVKLSRLEVGDNMDKKENLEKNGEATEKAVESITVTVTQPAEDTAPHLSPALALDMRTPDYDRTVLTLDLPPAPLPVINVTEFNTQETQENHAITVTNGNCNPTTCDKPAATSNNVARDDSGNTVPPPSPVTSFAQTKCSAVIPTILLTTK